MDPDETLRKTRNAATAINNSGKEVDTTLTELEPCIEELVEGFLDLDEWLSRGGYLPGEWGKRRKPGRPVLEEPGQVLEGVNHGTRNAYNKGCRCLACRRANREAGSRHRMRTKEQSSA